MLLLESFQNQMYLHIVPTYSICGVHPSVLPIYDPLDRVILKSEKIGEEPKEKMKHFPFIN